MYFPGNLIILVLKTLIYWKSFHVDIYTLFFKEFIKFVIGVSPIYFSIMHYY